MINNKKGIIIRFTILFVLTYVIVCSFKLDREYQRVDLILEDECFTVNYVMQQQVLNGGDDSFVFWKQYDQKFVSEDEFDRKVQAPVIAVCGDSSIFLNGQYVLWYGDKNQCIIGTNTAFKLFGSSNVAGKYVTYNNKKYLILGVTDRYENLFAYEVDKRDTVIFDRLSVALRNAETKARCVSRIRGELGISGIVVDYEVIFFLMRLISMIMVIIIILNMIFILHKFINKKFEFNKMVKVIFDATTFAVVLMVVFICLCLINIPSDYLPVMWSDYQHWGLLVKEKVASIKILATMKKCL